KVGRLLDLVHLAGFARRYPSQLSGGQRQRVALARALAVEPRLLLLDEPFGALDAQVRKDLRRWLRQLHEEMGLTTVFVTHDQEEALELADEVVVMNRGRIEQVGTPQEIYDNPATPFVFNFLGNVNRLDCDVRAGEARGAGWRAPAAGMADGPCVAFVRPHDVEVAADTGVPATIRHVTVLGPVVRADLVLGDGTAVEAEISREAHARFALTPGRKTALAFRKMAVFPA
ncbi:MAG TPA: TOBE-like domain-containing protein, partial [Candidatus Omnitrophota bacterium]|nr:TOBE-like domain-containing protein [Candidatus Omnitrophota bacterium]